MAVLRDFSDIYKRVLRDVGLDEDTDDYQVLAKDWVNRAYERLNRLYFLPRRRGVFRFATEINKNDGTVTVTKGSRTITFTGVTLASTDIGRYFSTDLNSRIRYRIIAVPTSSTATLDLPYAKQSEIYIKYEIWTRDYLLPSLIEDVQIIRINGLEIDFTKEGDFDVRFPVPQKFKAIDYYTIRGKDRLTRSYSAGTISGSSSGSVITGVGTEFLDNVAAGDFIEVTGDNSTPLELHIKSIESDTQFTIVEKLTEAVTAKTYTSTSDDAYTISLNGSDNEDNPYIVEVEGKMKIYPLLEDTEVPDLPREIFEMFVQGGKAFGLDWFEDTRAQKELTKFDNDVLTYDSLRENDNQRDTMEWGLNHRDLHGQFPSRRYL